MIYHKKGTADGKYCDNYGAQWLKGVEGQEYKIVDWKAADGV
jgi:hypothetical protein